MEPIIASVSFKNSPFEFDEMASKPGAEVWAIRMPVDVSLGYCCWPAELRVPPCVSPY